MDKESLIEFLESLDLEPKQLEEAVSYINRQENASGANSGLSEPLLDIESLRSALALEEDPQKRLAIAARIISLELG